MTKNLTEGKPLQLILGFAIPVLLSLLFQQFYSLVDTMIVGKTLGSDALAAVGSTGSLNFMVIGFCTGVCAGFAIPVAQSFGAKDEDLLKRYIGSSTWLCIIFSVVMAVGTALPCRFILQIMDTPPEILDKNKKGFTLVELMIVVVIMGILVAVAIPIYGAVTDNAEKKTCADNRRTIQSMVTTYQMTGGEGGSQIPWATLEAANLTEDDDFLAKFEGGTLPECPAGGTYGIEITPDATTGARNITVTCLDDTGAALHTNTDGSEVE